MLIPSTLDNSPAPPGAHVASLFCQHVTPQFADGSSWDEHREIVADLMIDTVEREVIDHNGNRHASDKVN
jgi:phytoene dehydrogenase-like protein